MIPSRVPSLSAGPSFRKNALMLLDGEGGMVRELLDSKQVDPGTYSVEWDGTAGYGAPARMEFPYLIRISANGETIYRKVIPRGVSR